MVTENEKITEKYFQKFEENTFTSVGLKSGMISIRGV